MSDTDEMFTGGGVMEYAPVIVDNLFMEYIKKIKRSCYEQIVMKGNPDDIQSQTSDVLYQYVGLLQKIQQLFIKLIGPPFNLNHINEELNTIPDSIHEIIKQCIHIMQSEYMKISIMKHPTVYVTFINQSYHILPFVM